MKKKTKPRKLRLVKSATKKAPVAPYGYRRVWTVPSLPVAGTASSRYNEMQRLQKRGPLLHAFPVQAARVDQYPEAFTDRLQYWRDGTLSNWDLAPASILLSVHHNMTGAHIVSRNEFSAHHGGVMGPETSSLGLYYDVVALVTRGERPDRHFGSRRQLAAALRDAADLLEAPVTLDRATRK